MIPALGTPLSNIPPTWRSDRLKDVVALRAEKTTEESLEEDYLELEDLDSGTGRLLSRRNSIGVESAMTLFNKRDVLFGKLRPYLAKYYEAEFDGKCTGEILAFKPTRITSRFLYHWVSSSWFLQTSTALSYGAKMPRVNWPTQLATFVTPLPPPEEQKRIAAFLDASCEAIDAALETKTEQLDLLNSLRLSFLHSVFENSSWPVERIKDVATKIGSGVTPDGGAAGYLDEGIPLLRSQNVHFDGLRLEDVAFISTETHEDMCNSQLKPKDVLINITGASIGRCTYVPDKFGEGNVNQHVCIMRPNHQIDCRFLAAYLSSPAGQGQVLSAFTGASRQGLSHKELGLIQIPLPKRETQYSVIEKLQEFDGRVRLTTKSLLSQIDLLRKYRASLIHECVTGQRRITEQDLDRVKAHG